MNDNISKQFFDILIKTDEECRNHLSNLKNKLKLDEQEISLLQSCINATNANDGDIIKYGPDEVFGLLSLANKYSDDTLEILMCMFHLNESFDCVMEDNSQLISVNAE